MNDQASRNYVSLQKFNDLAESYLKENMAWKILDLYRVFVNNGVDGRERFGMEKLLRKEFPFIMTKDLYALVGKYDLALVQAPAWGINTPPLALASLSSYMRQRGYRILVQDLNIACFHLGGERFISTWNLAEALIFWNNMEDVLHFAEIHKDFLDRWADYVVGSGADIIGFSVYGSSYLMSLYLAEQIKKKKDSIKIVFGGPHMSKYLAGKSAAGNPHVDLVVDGEGELTLQEIIKRIKENRELSDCPGTISKGPEGIIVHEERELIKDLSSLPFPDFSDFDLEQYSKSNAIPVISSRGCPNRCIYCNEKSFSKRFRPRKAESIFGDMKHQIRLYPNIRFFEFHDSLVNGSIRELERLCDLIIEDGLKIQWSGQAIIRKEMDLCLLTKLAKAGCICLGYGMETASAGLMEKIGKVFSKGADISAILKESKKAGVYCSLNFMFGLPGETDEDFEEVLNFIMGNKEYIGSVNPSAGFCLFAPGTSGYEEPEKYGIDFRYGHQYWEADEGKNNYEVRLKRFEAFCSLVYDLKINTTYPHRRLLNRDEMLKDYYLKTGQLKKALPHLFNLMSEDKACDNDIREFHRCWSVAPEIFKEFIFDERAGSLSIVKVFRTHVERMIDDTIGRGDLKRAVSVLEDALIVDTAYINYYLLLTELNIKLERFEDVLKVLESLRRERPDYEETKVYIDKIRNYMEKAVVA